MLINKGLYNYSCIVDAMTSGVSPENNLKYTIINGFANCETDDDSSANGKRYPKQNMTIFCHGGLSCYVDAEISTGDKILVVGKIVTQSRKRRGIYYYEQCIQAEEVYKNEWIKYYKGEKK